MVASGGFQHRREPVLALCFPLVLVGFALASFQLWRTGTRAVLNNTDGTVVEVVSDPAAPGYQAFAVPAHDAHPAHR